MVVSKVNYSYLILALIFTSQLALSAPTGDANHDCLVDGSDYNIWNRHKFTSVAGGSSVGDFNNDGIVNEQDYDIWVIHKFTDISNLALKFTVEVLGIEINGSSANTLPTKANAGVDNGSAINFIPLFNGSNLNVGSRQTRCLESPGKLVFEAEAVTPVIREGNNSYYGLSSEIRGAMLLFNGDNLSNQLRMLGARSPTNSQNSITSIIAEFLDGDNNVVLPSNEFIILFNLSNATGQNERDYQDVVLKIKTGAQALYEELSYFVGDPIGTDINLVNNVGCVQAWAQEGPGNFGSPGNILTSDGVSLFTDYRILLGLCQNTVLSGINYEAFEHYLLIWRLENYCDGNPNFWQGLDCNNQFNPDYVVPLGQPYNFDGYVLKDQNTIPAHSPGIYPDADRYSSLLFNVPSNCIKDQYDFRFDLGQNSFFNTALPVGDYVVVYKTLHENDFVGHAFVCGSKTPPGHHNYGPVATFHSNVVSRRTAFINDQRRWANSFTKRIQSTYQKKRTKKNKKDKKKEQKKTKN